MLLNTDTIDMIAMLAAVSTPMAMVEMIKVIDALPVDQRAELMALMWLGRDGGTFASQLARAVEAVDDKVGFYMAEQGVSLSIFLREGVRQLNHDGREDGPSSVSPGVTS